MTKNLKNQLMLYKQTKNDRVMNLSQYTHARVGLGHTGGHLKLQDWLSFQSGFAQAKDAVFSQFNVEEIQTLCDKLNLTSLEIHAKINNPTQFLLRPDLGRVLHEKSESQLKHFITQHSDSCNNDLLIVISGGLSPIAIQHQIPHFLPLLIKQIRQQNWSIAPIIINPRGRVALGDELNSYFQAKIVVMLIGERPGLSTPDSLGIYFTFDAKPGYTDEQRNCISNIHQQGLSSTYAINKLIPLLQRVFTNRHSGVGLKDDSKPTSLE